MSVVGLALAAGAILATLLLVRFGRGRDRARAAAFERLAHATGLRPSERGDAARRGLAKLPGLPGPGRIVFGEVVRGEDEILADLRVAVPQKERRTDRRSTLAAWRHAAPAALPGSTRVFLEEQDDPSPSGFGRLLLADDGEWVSCRTLSGRVPDDRLAAFRDRARQVAEGRLGPR